MLVVFCYLERDRTKFLNFKWKAFHTLQPITTRSYVCIFKSKIKIILKLNVCWKVTAEILGREIKYILHLVFLLVFTLKNS